MKQLTMIHGCFISCVDGSREEGLDVHMVTPLPLHPTIVGGAGCNSLIDGLPLVVKNDNLVSDVAHL
jgi:hypothetical protein